MLKKATATLLALFAAAAFAAVDANDASVADLDSIKGIGPGTSSKIVEQRKAAKFKDWNDLIQRVPGIGEKRAAKLSGDGLTVGGQAFKPSGKPADKMERKEDKKAKTKGDEPKDKMPKDDGAKEKPAGKDKEKDKAKAVQ